MKLSIVATLYQSSPYISEFVARCDSVAREFAGDDFEILLVNDGSPDDSLDRAIAEAKKSSRICIVDLSRNFGHHKAIMTGLAHAAGDHVFLIDSDLEEYPEWLMPFVRQMELVRCDVVYGVQEQRKGGLVERVTGQWFYSIFRRLTGLDLPENVVTARLMTRRYVDALVAHDEREVFLAGLWHITGFAQHPYIVRKESTSETTYTFRRKLALLVNSVTSFSNVPLMSIFYFGGIIFLSSLTFTAWLLFQWAFLARPLQGWTSVIASIWLLGGLVISMIGVIGIYLSKIFSETKRRPYTIVRQIHRYHD
jgi:putative glycosyltransferase